ncbi:MAG: hypothetical protein LBJ00_06330 [Planctomycetaceae bacterium]|jgi:hypothetical protein|nr:hypothetical protein [Planctomycetaceae bacterium]
MFNRKIYGNDKCNNNDSRTKSLLSLSFFCRVFFVTIFCLLFETVFVFGQNFKSWEVDSALSAKRDEIMTAMKQGNAPAANRADWNAFFDKFYFARWTTDGNIGFVQTYSRDLITRDLKNATGGARTFFLAKSLETLMKMVNDKTLNPTARYNAILTVGQLATKEAAPPEPPTYYEDALKQLIALYDNESTAEYIRFGALVGIVRHAQAGISNEEFKNNKVPAIFIKTIESKSPVADRDADDQQKLDWLRTRAFDGLAALKIADQNVMQNVLTVIKNVIRSETESFDMRCRAARLLGELDLQSVADKIKPAEFGQISGLLISLTKSYCDWEVNKIDSMVNKSFGGRQPNNPSMPRMPVGRFDGMSGTGENTVVEPPFASLPLSVQREIIVTTQRVKSNSLYYLLYGMRGGKLTGPTSNGIISVLKTDDPNNKKLSSTTKSIASLIEILDKGKPETATTGTLPTRTPRPVAAAKGQYKVNFTTLREALQKCSDEISEIITGKKVEPDQPKAA